MEEVHNKLRTLDTGSRLNLLLPAPGAVLQWAAQRELGQRLSVTLPMACAHGIPLPTSSPSSLVVSKTHTAPLLTHSLQKGPFGHPKKPPGCLCLSGHTTRNDKASLPAEAHHAQKHFLQIFKKFIY